MLSTGLGSVPFYFFNELSSIWIGISNGKNNGITFPKDSTSFIYEPYPIAMAAGMMIAASVGLVVEGYLEDPLSHDGKEMFGFGSVVVRLLAGCMVRPRQIVGLFDERTRSVVIHLTLHCSWEWRSCSWWIGG